LRVGMRERQIGLGGVYFYMDKLGLRCLLYLVLSAPVLLAQGAPAPGPGQGPGQGPGLGPHGAREQIADPSSVDSGSQQLFALANQTRAAHGLGALKWDPALAAAALRHCNRMAQEGPISHRYGGELDLTARASEAGAHFSLIEENIAVGSTPARIHEAWMESPDHRDNLLNPAIDRVGIAVVYADKVLFAVSDYGRGVEVMNQAQVEALFAHMLRDKGLAIRKDPAQARAYCASSGRFTGNDPPGFLMRWQNPDLTQLPAELVQRVASGEYGQASVGSCPAQDVGGGFTIYRVAVLLYESDAAARAKHYY